MRRPIVEGTEQGLPVCGNALAISATWIPQWRRSPGQKEGGRPGVRVVPPSRVEDPFKSSGRRTCSTISIRSSYLTSRPATVRWRGSQSLRASRGCLAQSGEWARLTSKTPILRVGLLTASGQFPRSAPASQDHRRGVPPNLQRARKTSSSGFVSGRM